MCFDTFLVPRGLIPRDGSTANCQAPSRTWRKLLPFPESFCETGYSISYGISYSIKQFWLLLIMYLSNSETNQIPRDTWLPRDFPIRLWNVSAPGSADISALDIARP